MSLAGNLRQFPLPDVLRTIESGQRTGRLALARGSLQADIYFANGQWLLGDRRGMGQTLVQQFVRAGVLTSAQVESALGVPFAQAITLPDVQAVRLLINARLMTQEHLRSWVINDAIALLKTILSWPEGSFLFEEGVAVPSGRVALPLLVGPLVAQAMRATPSAPSTPSAPRHPPHITADAILAFAEVDANTNATIQLTREQWKVLTRVDGHTPLWAIAQALGAPEPVILRLASELAAAGIVVTAGRASPIAPIS